ncbi:MAG: hypothetical protein ACRDJG_06630 [Actinomycetota bacterium]
MATADEDARLVVALSALGREAVGATRRLTHGQRVLVGGTRGTVSASG